MSRPQRSPGFYRIVLAIPLLMLGYLFASGRIVAYFRVFGAATSGRVDQNAFNSSFVTAILWIGSMAPLTWAAWEIGREHVAARRLGYVQLIGLREVWRRALRHRDDAAIVADEAAFRAPPADDARRALVWGLVVALIVPSFFASVAPQLRSPLALAWLIGAGLLVGGAAYCRRRSMAYLRDEPGRWSMFREWQLLNAGRYEAPARRFVRAQIAISIVLPVWWLGGGLLVMSLSSSR